MKTHISILFVMMVVGCGKTKQPVKELTLEEKIFGTYEVKKYGDTFRLVFLADGIMQTSLDDADFILFDKWEIVDGEIHIPGNHWNVLPASQKWINIYSLNKDTSITHMANIIDGKREDVPKENQHTYKKTSSSLPSKRD